MNDSTNQLVEHFFRHESANLIAVLTRAFGIRRLNLVEDMVQLAMLEAMNTWKQKGAPENPSGWIYRVAKRRTLDALRREQVHDRALGFAGHGAECESSLVDDWMNQQNIPDSLLRMMFVCCHPSLDRASQVAMTLKTLCGFSVPEIARGLLLSKDATKKRIQRAKRSLADQNIIIELPNEEELQDRLDAVHDVLYLMFNEGYSTTCGDIAIRDDICEEAARLCHMLCVDAPVANSSTKALLALMLFHSARLESRIDAEGGVILLEEQDRSRWNQDLIEVGQNWLAKSADGSPSRYHYEASIALQHCRARDVESTNWSLIVLIYNQLIEATNSPVYRLNRAIAMGQSGQLEQAASELEALQDGRDLRDYFLLDCAFARICELRSDWSGAISRYQKALSRNLATHERSLLQRKIAAITERK